MRNDHETSITQQTILYRSMPSDVPEKQCTVCGEYFPATTEFFYRCSGKGNNLYTYCKACKYKKQEAYDKTLYSNPEALAHRQAYHKAYYSRPDIVEHLHTYYSSPERQAYGRNRRARRNAVQGSHTPEQIQEQLKRQKHKCYYCSQKIKKQNGKYFYHVDHTFPLSRVVGTDIPANDISYLVLTCPTCNMRKHNKFPHEFPEGGKLL